MMIARKIFFPNCFASPLRPVSYAYGPRRLGAGKKEIRNKRQQQNWRDALISVGDAITRSTFKFICFLHDPPPPPPAATPPSPRHGNDKSMHRSTSSYLECESKNPPLRFSNIFPNGWEFLVQILHVYYASLFTQDCKFLLNYLQLWRSYAIWSATTIICSKCPCSPYLIANIPCQFIKLGINVAEIYRKMSIYVLSANDKESRKNDPGSTKKVWILFKN